MFQVSLSTLLTPPPAPGAGLPAALSGAFSATLAGMVTTPDGTDVGKSAPAARQTPAESGKSLPTEADESLLLPASDDRLDPVAALASPNAQPIASQSDAADPIVAAKADQASTRSEPAALPIADNPPLTSGPIIISIATLSLAGNGDEPAADSAAPKTPDGARKKTDGAAPMVAQPIFMMGSPIVMPPPPAPAAVSSGEAVVPGTSALRAATTIPATPAPSPRPSGIDAQSIILGSDPANPAPLSAAQITATGESDGDAGAPAGSNVTAAPAKPLTATADASARPVAVPSEAAPSASGRHADSIAGRPGRAPARAQEEIIGRAEAVRTTHRGDARVATGNMASRSIACGMTGARSPKSGRASLQPPAISGAGKPVDIAAADPTASRGNATPPPASVLGRSLDSASSDKASQPVATGATPASPSRVTTADALPTPGVVTAAATLPTAVALPRPAMLPAGILFGIALDQRRTPADRPSPRDEALQALSALTGAGSAAPVAAAAGGAQHGMLDMRRDDWPQAMIDRIDALRDAADATSTRITLMPDALGKVDVSLRHDGDTVHVHFTADTAQTRTMLADAQPRLADAAQARGIRLGQTSVGAGGGEAGRQQPRQPSVPMPSRPVSATPAPADAAPDSSRLA